MNWDEIRKNYPAACNQVYLNTASCGLISKHTAQAQSAHFQAYLEKGGNAYEGWTSLVQETRQLAAKLINVPKEDLLFVHNYTSAMNQIAAMWQSKYKRVLMLKGDYPSVTLPWEAHGYDTKYFEADEKDIISLTSIEEALKNFKPDILSISHIHFCTGFRLDLQRVVELCKRYEAKLVADATQSLGAYSIDIKKQGIDVLISSVYKWTTAGYGLGVCYINPELFDDCYPYFAGNNPYGQAIINYTNSSIQSKRAAFETGHANFPAINSLNNALKDISEIGVENISQRINQLLGQLLGLVAAFKDDLSVLSFPKENRSGIFSLNIDPQVVDELLEQNIITSYRAKGVRVSLHFYNNENDLEKLCTALKSLK